MQNMNSGYRRWAHISGWAVALLYFAHRWNTILQARTDRALPLREDLRGWHYLLGTALLVFVIVRLWCWFKDGDPGPAPGVRAGVHSFGRQLAITAYVLLFAAPLLGLFYAWSDGLTVHLGPFVTVPALVGESRAIWQFAGYFHSSLGAMLLILSFLALAAAGYSTLRSNRGLMTALPPGFGAQALLIATANVYALTTFRSADPGPKAVLALWGICLAIAVLGWWLHRNRQPQTSSRPSGALAKAFGGFAIVSVLAVGAYGPYRQFKVTPWPMGTTVESPDGAVWHPEPVTRVRVALSTPFEAKVKAKTYKWCVFCHTMKKDDTAFKVGPNLYAIFGQKAGGVPGYTYTDAMMAARAKGLVWTDETIAAYIADPQHFMPGTSMIVSSGPIPDPKVQAAVVNLLKRDTMPPDKIDPAG
jgi:cytochrome c2/cytochrome b561